MLTKLYNILVAKEPEVPYGRYVMMERGFIKHIRAMEHEVTYDGLVGIKPEVT